MRTERGFGLLASPPDAVRDLAPGVRVGGKYELRRKIGAGAMGQVWTARHVSLKEDVAIKLVLRETQDDGSQIDRRFLVEARIASQLSRKTRHVVSVTDHGVDGRYSYLVMELLTGESLEARLARTGPLSLRKVVALVHQVARALSVAHADGIVHRDLKPSNVFVTIDEDGKALIKLLDFGIAKLRRPAETETSKIRTIPGCVIGTPAYMSPEQARGESIDHRADVWALVVIAFELLTGEFPFDGASTLELFSRICNVDATPITAFRSDLGSVSDVFARAFSEHVEDRFASASDFACALERAAGSHRPGSAAVAAISLPPPSLPRVRFDHRRKSDSPAPKTPAPAVAEETMSSLARGAPPIEGTVSLPAASGPASVPPPRPLARSTLKMAPAVTPPRPLDDLVAAGVPRRSSSRVLAAVAALGALLTMFALMLTYFEPAPPPSPTAAAEPPSPGVDDPAAAQAEREVPPPPPTTATLPVAVGITRGRVASNGVPPAPAPKPHVATAPSTAASASAEPAAAPAVAPAKRVDKSDVF